ncbi:hypothetical protein P154DRAFT_64278 [Amniculicola lignicola CBS 123094]|uniref:Uncharacterized protein n=1 Tax=Amniculicola lignicola CBS 123094 TaxID=1392246 RepID=A0A6A5WUX3_9PLEO|nr:hypothetical protein P154DRAFT_64278 [Amniculicola lignicola CBS 123094]
MRLCSTDCQVALPSTSFAPNCVLALPSFSSPPSSSQSLSDSSIPISSPDTRLHPLAHHRYSLKIKMAFRSDSPNPQKETAFPTRM